MMLAPGLGLVRNAQPHSGGDALEHGVHVLEDVGRRDAHNPDADRLQALVAPPGDGVVLLSSSMAIAMPRRWQLKSTMALPTTAWRVNL